MSIRNTALVLLILIIAVLLSPTPQVVYATSGSMEPVLSTGSVYLVDTLDDAPQKGDIVMFSSPEQGRVTHRVIDIPRDGRFITKGDANNAPDQTGAKEALEQEDIIGTVPTIFGHPLIIPGSAAVTSFVSANPIAALLSLWLIFGVGYLLMTGEVDVLLIKNVAVPLLTVAFIASVVFVSMGVSSEVAFLGTSGPHGGNPELVPANVESTQTLSLETSSPPLLGNRMISATGELSVVGVDPHANGTNITVSVPAVPDNSVSRGGLIVNYYPPVLPYGPLSTLHRFHPIMASLVTVSICYGPVYLLYVAMLDPQKRLRGYLSGGGKR